MGSLRQIGAGFLLGLLSIAVIIGGFTLSRAEGGAEIAIPLLTASPLAVVATAYPTSPVLTETSQVTASASVASFTATIANTETPVPTSTLPASPTPPPSSSSCLPPAGWLAIRIQGYETLSSLAQKYKTTTDAIKRGNCLSNDQLASGSYIYVPPIPTATLIPCGAPYGWGTYYVVAGDTLYSISIRYRVTVAELQRANCMGSSALIAVGKPIRVPNVATSTSSVKTPTWTMSPVLEVASPTFTQVPPTATTEVPTTIPPPTLTTQPPPTLTTVPSATASPTTPAPSQG